MSTNNAIGVTVSQRYLAAYHNKSADDFLRWCAQRQRRRHVVPFKLTRRPRLLGIMYIVVAIDGTTRGTFQLLPSNHGIQYLSARALVSRFDLRPPLFLTGWYALCDSTMWNPNIPRRRPQNIRSNYYTTVEPA